MLAFIDTRKSFSFYLEKFLPFHSSCQCFQALCVDIYISQNGITSAIFSDHLANLSMSSCIFLDNSSGASVKEKYRKTTEVVRPCEENERGAHSENNARCRHTREKKTRAAKPKMERCV